MPRLRTATNYGKHTSGSHRRPSTRRVELVEQPASTLLDLQPPTRLITGWPGHRSPPRCTEAAGKLTERADHGRARQ